MSLTWEGPPPPKRKRASKKRVWFAIAEGYPELWGYVWLNNWVTPQDPKRPRPRWSTPLQIGAPL